MAFNLFSGSGFSVAVNSVDRASRFLCRVHSSGIIEERIKLTSAFASSRKFAVCITVDSVM